MRVNIYTNTQKSQFRNVKDGVWQILGIPITVDDAVMNGILYDKEDNAAGLPSYRNKVVTLRHPEDVNGNGISATDGQALSDHFSGGHIINTYNANGINYADAQFKEKMMLAQDNGEYYVNRLKNGESIGISTGLYFEGNNESGVNACGEQYHAKAINQEGDHVAMLPDEEPPAGGAATFIRFNGENDDQTLTVNIDEMISNANEKDTFYLIDDIATNDDEKSLLGKFWAACKHAFATNKNDCDNNDLEDNILITNQEGDAMRETLEKALEAKGIAFNAKDTDAELLGKLTAQSEQVDLTATNSAIASLTETVSALKAELAENKDTELEALAKQAAPFMGVEVEDAKALGANALHKVIAKNGAVVGGVNAANHESPNGKESLLSTKMPWEE